MSSDLPPRVKPRNLDEAQHLALLSFFPSVPERLRLFALLYRQSVDVRACLGTHVLRVRKRTDGRASQLSLPHLPSAPRHLLKTHLVVSSVSHQANYLP